MSGLTRQEMKRDEVREWLGRVFGWSHDHVRGILRTGGAILAVALLVVLVIDFSRRREVRAQELLDRGMEVWQAPVTATLDDSAPATEAEEGDEELEFADRESKVARARELFDEVHSRYGRTDAGGIAGVYLGEIAAQEGDRETARELWRSFLDRDPEHALAGAVRLNLFSLERAEGNADEVVAEIERLLAAGGGALPNDVLLWELGLTHEEAERPERAVDAFQRLVDDFPGSPYTPEARQHLDRLG